VNLIEAASLKSIPETVDAATVDVALVFLTRPTDLVEITKRKPTSADGWLLSDELRKEIVLPTSRAAVPWSGESPPMAIQPGLLCRTPAGRSPLGFGKD
jgi:hypothetical protein